MQVIWFTHFINALAQELGLKVAWFVKQGEPIKKAKARMIRAVWHQVIRLERVAVNLLARSCGHATLTTRVLSHLDSVAWKECLAGTHRTTPTFRLVEKYCMLIG